MAINALVWNRPDGGSVATTFNPDLAALARKRGTTVTKLKNKALRDLKARRPDLAGLTPAESASTDHDAAVKFGRYAWGRDGKFYLARAETAHMNRIRAARAKELTRLDNEFSRAQGRKNQPEMDRIEAQREALRQLPQTFDLSAATTPEELDALWPTELPPRSA